MTEETTPLFNREGAGKAGCQEARKGDPSEERREQILRAIGHFLKNSRRKP